MGVIDAKNEENRYVVPAVVKALAILEFFTTDSGPHTISEVSRLMKLPLSSTNTLLRSLHYCGYLTREGNRGAFRLTGKVMALAHTAQGEINLASMGEPYLKSLRKETRFTALLAVRDQDNVVFVAKARGESLVQLNAHVGQSLPMYCSTAGRSILAHLSRDEAAAILNEVELVRQTPNTVTSVPEFLDLLEKFKKRGYSEDREEYSVGIRGIGAPIFDHSGRVTSAVAVAGGVSDYRGRKMEIVKQVQRCARAISRRLGKA